MGRRYLSYHTTHPTSHTLKTHLSPLTAHHTTHPIPHDTPFRASPTLILDQQYQQYFSFTNTFFHRDDMLFFCILFSLSSGVKKTPSQPLPGGTPADPMGGSSGRDRSGSGVDGLGMVSSHSNLGGGGDWLSPAPDSSSVVATPTTAGSAVGGRSRSPASAASKYPWNGFSAPIRGFNRNKQQTPMSSGDAGSSSSSTTTGPGLTNNQWTNPTTAFSSSLDFLDGGFRELVRCRQVLRGSFAFSYYTFADDEELDAAGGAGAAATGADGKVLLSRQLLRRHRGR